MQIKCIYSTYVFSMEIVFTQINIPLLMSLQTRANDDLCHGDYPYSTLLRTNS